MIFFSVRERNFFFSSPRVHHVLPELPRTAAAAFRLLFGHAVSLPQLSAARPARVAAVLPVRHRPVVIAAKRVTFATTADRVVVAAAAAAAFFIALIVAAVLLTEAVPCELIYTSVEKVEKVWLPGKLIERFNIPCIFCYF